MKKDTCLGHSGLSSDEYEWHNINMSNWRSVIYIWSAGCNNMKSPTISKVQNYSDAIQIMVWH